MYLVRSYIESSSANKNIHADKTNLRRFAMQLYFSGDVKRYAV